MHLPRCLLHAIALLALTTATAHATTPVARTSFQIVESVPEATSYGEPGVPRTQDVWLQMIQGATQRIDIAAFYISDKPGSAMTPILDALTARADGGVKVRILLDPTLLKDNQASVDRLRNARGIDVRILPVGQLSGGILHAKYMVVDDRSVFIGSQNWDWRALDQIHEIGARIDNVRFAQTVEATFDGNWQRAGNPELPAATAKQPGFTPVTMQNPETLDSQGNDPLTVFPAFSPPALLPSWATTEQAALIHMIEASQHVLRIQMMTLSAINLYGAKGWWSELDAALRDAAARGVDVRLLVADWALEEPTQAYLKSLAVLPNITVKFTRLPPSPQGFIPFARVDHAKYAIADARHIYIGTGNWERSYFHNSVNASVFVEGAAPAATLTRIFDRDWNGPYATVLDVGKQYLAPRIQ